MNGAPPQVIRIGSEHVLINSPDLDALSKNRRVLFGLTIWPQVEWLMKKNGERTYTQDVARSVAKLVGCPWTTLLSVREILNHQPDLIPLWESGIGFKDLERAAGRVVRSRIEEGRKSESKYADSYFGHGDKFDQAVQPLMHYLVAWSRRDFEFRHVNPREAQRRLKKVERLQKLLSSATEDLRRRSHRATLTAPQEKRKGKV